MKKIKTNFNSFDLRLPANAAPIAVPKRTVGIK